MTSATLTRLRHLARVIHQAEDVDGVTAAWRDMYYATRRALMFELLCAPPLVRFREDFDDARN